MVYDAGASVSMIRKDLAQNSKVSIIWTPPCVYLQTVTGDKIQAHRKANITLRKFRFGLIDYPHSNNSKGGVLIVLSVVDLSNSVIPLRMANISDKRRTIQEEEVISSRAPVTCVDRMLNNQDFSSDYVVKVLLQNTDLDEKQRCAAGGLIKEFQGLFSRTSEDFGRPRLTKHRIDTGDHPPNKQHPQRLPFAKHK
ncbi:retrovirus-related Pol polyprotein from transposon 412 [Trichonephila clavipes]|nr:retrovirus-related Pol polyprotein from transposon 412 [Trichonephila clavipes]